MPNGGSGKASSHLSNITILSGLSSACKSLYDSVPASRSDAAASGSKLSKNMSLADVDSKVSSTRRTQASSSP